MLAPGWSEGTVTPRDGWQRYINAMRDHMAADERLFDRLRYILGDALSPPGHLDPLEKATWRDLLRASEAASIGHREALDEFLASESTRPR